MRIKRLVRNDNLWLGLIAFAAVVMFWTLLITSMHVYSGLNGGVAFGTETCNVGFEWKGAIGPFVSCEIGQFWPFGE